MGIFVVTADKIVIALFLFAQTGAAIKYFMRLEKRLDRIDYQLYENGGSSMKDQMNDTRDDLQELKTSFLVLKAKLGE
jgi:chitinase